MPVFTKFFFTILHHNPEEGTSTSGSNSPAHECQCLLSLDLRPLRGQLLLLMGQGLLHEHHLDALLHGILFGLADQIVLVGG